MGDNNGQYKETDEIESRQETRHDAQENRKTCRSQANKKECQEAYPQSASQRNIEADPSTSTEA